MTVACNESALQMLPTTRVVPTDPATLLHTTQDPATDSNPFAHTITKSLPMLGDHVSRTDTCTGDDPSPATGIASHVTLPKLMVFAP